MHITATDPLASPLQALSAHLTGPHVLDSSSVFWGAGQIRTCILERQQATNVHATVRPSIVHAFRQPKVYRQSGFILMQGT